MDALIQGVSLTPLRHIKGDAGDIFHIMRKDTPGFKQFGEVYISTVKQGSVKGWKRHREMTLNIVVPAGAIRFVLYNEKDKTLMDVVLSPDNYQRLTVLPGTWMAFRGEGPEESFLVNFADITHDPSEAESMPLDNSMIPYAWQ